MDTEVWQLLITAVATFLAASAGFWGYARNRDISKEAALAARDLAASASTRLLMGLAHDRIITLGLKYMERGWISKDEYEDFRQYLYEPYTALGGNGTAERIMHAVERVPIRSLHMLDTPIRSTDPTGSDETPKSRARRALMDIYEGEDRREQ